MNRVRELREEKKLKQVELALQLNISQATLSNWERGIHDPDNESLLALSQIFECSLDYLLGKSASRLSYEESVSMDNVYFRIAADAKRSGIKPEDLKMAVDFLKRAKQRGEQTDTIR